MSGAFVDEGVMVVEHYLDENTVERCKRTPVKRYGAILADPPWRYITWSDRGRDRCPDGARLLATSGYPTMLFAELKALPVASWPARDCRLFMWTTDSHLPQALDSGRLGGSATARSHSSGRSEPRPTELGISAAARPRARAQSCACCSCAAT
jgi:hypothetical protein